jgi:SAM-dependent methyltransferase
VNAVSGRDPDEERREILELWDRAAAGWGRQQASWAEQTAPVTTWMIDAAGLGAGQRVLDLAAGPGELALLAARLVEPGGTVICSDQSDAMVELARKRAAELGLRNVEFRVLGGEWIDLALASIDVVLCRWGYMLMVDPAAALRETRRVLGSGGRVVLAAWDARERNPWSTIPTAVLVEHGLASPPVPGTPGPFALANEDLLRSMLEEAGFVDVVIEGVDLWRRAPDLDTWWAAHLDLSASSLASFQQADEAQTAAIEAELAVRLAPYTSENGEIAVPGRTFVAVAEA